MPKPMFIDLSHHNVVPESFEPAKASGVVGVIHKLTEGDGFVDDKVGARHYLANEAGLLWGVYHFIRPGDPREQAQFFCSEAEEVADQHTLLALDWEDPTVSLDDAVAFMEEVERITGHTPVLYSGHVLKDALKGEADPRLSKYRLWLAQYASSPTLPPGFETYWGWQYTDAGNVPGITPPTDLNDYQGSAKELRNNWSGTGPVPPPVELQRQLIYVKAGDVQIKMAITVPVGIPVEVFVGD